MLLTLAVGGNNLGRLLIMIQLVWSGPWCRGLRDLRNQLMPGRCSGGWPHRVRSSHRTSVVTEQRRAHPRTSNRHPTAAEGRLCRNSMDDLHDRRTGTALFCRSELALRPAPGTAFLGKSLLAFRGGVIIPARSCCPPCGFGPAVGPTLGACSGGPRCLLCRGVPGAPAERWTPTPGS
jgi:hypothetical protein